MQRQRARAQRVLLALHQAHLHEEVNRVEEGGGCRDWFSDTEAAGKGKGGGGGGVCFGGRCNRLRGFTGGRTEIGVACQHVSSCQCVSNILFFLYLCFFFLLGEHLGDSFFLFVFKNYFGMLVSAHSPSLPYFFSRPPWWLCHWSGYPAVPGLIKGIKQNLPAPPRAHQKTHSFPNTESQERFRHKKLNKPCSFTWQTQQTTKNRA